MPERPFVRAVNSALKLAVIAGFAGFGVCILFMFAKSSYRPEIFEPYPLFGASLANLHRGIVIVYAGLWLSWAVVTLRRVSGDSAAAGIVMCGFCALLMLVAGAGAAYGLDSANALLDFSSPVRTAVLLRNVRREDTSTIRGKSSVLIATVSPIERPDRQFDMNWNSCRLKPDEVSPFAAIRVGPGAFGAPWVALPVECRPLAVGDRPLFGSFRLGNAPAIVATVEPEAADVREMRAARRFDLLQTFNGFVNGAPGSRRGQAEAALSDAELALLAEGRAELQKALEPLVIGDAPEKAKDIGRAAIRIVNEDRQRQDPGYLLTLWKQGIEAVAPKVPMVVIRSGNGSGVLTDFQCSRCFILSEDTVDMGIYRAFSGRTAPGLGGNQIFLLDATGRLTFKADLSDTALVPKLADSLKAVVATK
jgi:hypothetical protein